MNPAMDELKRRLAIYEQREQEAVANANMARGAIIAAREFVQYLETLPKPGDEVQAEEENDGDGSGRPRIVPLNKEDPQCPTPK